MEERGEKAIAGEAVGLPAQQRGAEALSKAPGVGAIFGVRTSDITDAPGYERGSYHVRLRLLVHRKQHLVCGAQRLRTFSRIDDDVPLAGFDRIARTDVHAENRVDATPAGRWCGGILVHPISVW